MAANYSRTMTESADHGKRVAVVGVGAVGGVFAAHLSEVHDVVACVRRSFTDYKIESPQLPFGGPAHAVTSPGEIGWDAPADVVFVGLKSQHTDGAAAWFDPLCGPDTLVVAMQNGIEASERLAPYVNGASVVAAVVYCGAELLAPGHIRHDNQALLIVPDDETGHRTAALAEGTPLTVDPSDKYDRARWVKLGINSVVNGLTALTGKSMDVLTDPGIARIGADLLTERWTVGQACGVDLSLDGLDDMIAKMGKNVGGRTSMLHDREAGRPTEHDAIHGAILRKGQEHGVSTPTTQLIHDLIAAGGSAS